MPHHMRTGLGLAGTVAIALSVAAPSVASTPTSSAATASPTPAAVPAAKPDNAKAKGPFTEVDVLSFSDFHGHLEATDPPLPKNVDPTQTPVGGVAHLAANIKAQAGESSVIVSAGDNIGGSTFLSGMFHDEPTIEALDALGVEVSAVGNHELDEGLAELLRIQDGGNHPTDGGYQDTPYAGAEMQYIAANILDKATGQPVLPPTYVKKIKGVKVGFIGLTTPETTSLVSPGGITSIRFDEMAASANRAARQLHAQGVETMVVLSHEGGNQTGTLNECRDLTGPIVELNKALSSRIDGIVTGHTHSAFNCTLQDPQGRPRPVVASGDWGRAFNKMTLTVDRRNGDVVRERTTSTNHLSTRTATDPAVQAVVDRWVVKAGPARAQVVGTVAQDVIGDASGNRGIETPMADLLADAMLWGTKAPEAGGAQISFMNVGGVRASFLRDQISNGEQVGEITYEEAYKVAPFGNLLVSVDMTGQDIKAVLEQQYVPTRGRQYLALGVSKGFSYTWDDSKPQGSKVSGMTLDGVAIDPAKTYRVSTLSFLAEGGDSFTAFRKTNLLGGPEDLENLTRYLGAHPGITPPEDRVAGL